MDNAVIYWRVSTSGQDESSQLDDLINFASNSNYHIVETFGETQSGYNNKEQERAELIRMQDYVLQNNIRTIIMWELSRLGRSTAQTLNWIEFYTQHNVNIIFKNNNIQTLFGGVTNTLLIPIYSAIADLEGKTLKDRVTRGRMKAAKEGKSVGFTKMPLGFTKDENGFIKINEQEAIIVKDIFTKVSNGVSATRIAKDLSGVVPTFKEKHNKDKKLKNGEIVKPENWNPKTIKNIITSTRYKGVRTYGNVEIKIPRIISDELWDLANKRLKEHTGYICDTKYDYLAKSKIVCGQCKYIMKSLRKYNKKGTDVLYYTCQSYLHTGKNCDCGRFRSEVFDRLLYKTLFEEADGLMILRAKGNRKSKIESIDKKINHLYGIKKEINNDKERVAILFRREVYSPERFDEELVKLNKKMNDVDTELLNLNIDKDKLNITDDNDFIKLMKTYYWDSDFKTRRKFVEDYIQRIVAYKVKRLDFDIEEAKGRQIKQYRDKVALMRKPKNKPMKQNEVIWYVEIFAFNDSEPIKCVMTSLTRSCVVNDTLKFNKEERSVQLESKSRSFRILSTIRKNKERESKGLTI